MASEPWRTTRFQKAVCAVARAGPTPLHIAFIMDGNRRFARDNGLALEKGHRLGYDTLERAMGWCDELGVKAITVYAFSIENFKRSTAEVEALMDLCSEKLRAMCSQDHIIQKRCVRVRFAGDLGRLSCRVCADMERVVQSTAHHSNSVLTICFAYTSRFEMAAAMRQLAMECERTHITSDDVTATALERAMCTWDSQIPCFNECMRGKVPPVDLLIRTSGEKRLSDFLLWQASRCVTIFTQVRWPELSLFRFIVLIIKFQLAQPELRRMLAGARAAGGEYESEGASSGGVALQAARPCQTDGQAWWYSNFLLFIGAGVGAAAVTAATAFVLGCEVGSALPIACGGTLAWTGVALLSPFIATGHGVWQRHIATESGSKQAFRVHEMSAARPGELQANLAGLNGCSAHGTN